MLALSAKPQNANDSSAYAKSIRINILGLPVRSITFFTDYKLSPANYLELTAAYHFPWNTGNNKILFFHFKDPFWFYTKFRLGLGYNHFYNQHFYMGPYLQYQYRYFDKIRIHAYVDHEGEAYDEDWTISRFKNEIGQYLKLGYSSKFRKRMILDFYFDVGFDFMLTREKVWSREGLFNSQIPGNYPVISTKITFPIAINMGFTFGFHN